MTAETTKMLRSRHLALRSLADEELMELVAGRDAHAFGVIFDRHGAVAYSLAYRMCGRRAMAEDVVQDAFLSMWRGGARYDRARGSVRSWVLGVVRNRTIDSFRQREIKQGRDVGDDTAAERIPAGERTDVEAARREEASAVRSALDGLVRDQRLVIELAYFGGFTHSQIAEMLELPAGTVKGRMRLGLAKLRLALGDPAEVVR